MKLREIIQEFVPCETCGNNDIKNFYFHVLVDKGSQPYVKCSECEEEFFSARAKRILDNVAASRKARVESKITFKKKTEIGEEFLHPLVKVLANM